ncbi:MAG: spore coat protein CotJB [Bacilli bacterium]
MYQYNSKIDYYNCEDNNYTQQYNLMDTNNNSLFNVENSLMMGTLFKGIYNKYKNYEPIDISISNQKEQLQFYLDSIGFSLHDLNLYLDIYSDDINLIELFNHLNVQYEMLKKDYESKFGPLLTTSKYNMTTPWQWNNSPWPWEKI